MKVLSPDQDRRLGSGVFAQPIPQLQAKIKLSSGQGHKSDSGDENHSAKGDFHVINF